MRWALGFLVLAVVLAIIKAALMGLAIAAGVALLFAFVRRPRSTALFMVVLTLSGLATARPLAAIITIGVVSLAVVLTAGGRGTRSPMRPSLPTLKDPQSYSEGHPLSYA